MSTTAPPHRLNRGAKFFPCILRFKITFCSYEIYSFSFAKFLSLIDNIIRVRELHSRITKEDFYFIMWQGSLYQVKGNYTVFPSTERHIENIYLVTLFHISVVYLLYCVLYELFEKVSVFLLHCRNVYKSQGHPISFRFINYDKFRSCID